MCQIYLPTDIVNQCVKIIYQKTQSTNVSNLSTKRHSQPMCQIYLSKDTVNQSVQNIYQKTQSTNVSKYLPTDTVEHCVKNIYQKTQSTNVSKLFTKRHSQPMCLKYKRCSEPKHQIDFWKLNLCAFL